MRWQRWEASIGVLGYTKLPILAAPCYGQLALVYPDTLMLASYFPPFLINTPPPPPPPILEKNHEEKRRKSVEKIEK